MGQVLHGSARTTAAVRRAIQQSQESMSAFAALRHQPEDRCQVEEARVHGRTSKFAVVELVEKADTRAAAAFLEALVEAVQYRIHTVVTDNGIQFADLPKNRGGITARWRGHPFDRLCHAHGVEHRLTKPNHPWTNGQVERMNRTIKDATVKRYFYDTHEQLKAHLTDFLKAYNFARRLKTLKGLAPYEYLCKLWTPDRFTLNPVHQMPGLNTL
jgi:IS30 family transposase